MGGTGEEIFDGLQLFIFQIFISVDFRYLYFKVFLAALDKVLILDIKACVYAAQRIGYEDSGQEKPDEEQLLYQRIGHYFPESSH